MKFDWKKFIKSVAIIAVPIAMQNVLTTTGSMVDTMMISNLGELEVGAVGLCAQFSSLMLSCYWGFVGGGMLFFSQFFGAGDDDNVNRSYGITFTLMMTVGLIFGLFAHFFPNLIMALYTDKPQIQAIGIEYLKIVGFAYPMQVYSMCMSALLRTTDRVKIPLIGAIASVITNIFFNYCLIFGNFGMPCLGVKGAAVATVISAFVNASVVLIMGKLSHHKYILALNRHFKWTKKSVILYFKKCAPILMNEMLIGIGIMIINVVLGRQSKSAIAATAVFRTFEGFIIAFFTGFSNAASVLVGKQIGAGNIKDAYQKAIRLIYLCQTVIAAAGIFLIAIHAPLLSKTMNLSGESFEICSKMLIIYTIAAFIRMGNWAQNDTFRSGGDATYGTVLEIVFQYIMVVPAVVLSGLVFKLPFLVTFAASYIDEPIRYILMHVHLYRGKWIKPVTPQGIQALKDGFK